jgi:hypothetical protein
MSANPGELIWRIVGSRVQRGRKQPQKGRARKIDLDTTLSASALRIKCAMRILRYVAALSLAVGANAALSSELGYPGSALAEFSQSKPLLTTTEAPAPAIAQGAAKPTNETIRYTGKCYARVDGRVRINGPCPVTWKTGDDVGVNLLAHSEEKHGAGTLWRVAVYRDGRKWYAHWGRSTDESNSDARADGPERRPRRHDLSEVKKHGSCWTNRRVRICERES